MQKPLFISTDKDMPGLRKNVTDWLALVQRFGGPDVYFYESFLKHPEKPFTETAINQCLTIAKENADSGFVIICKSPGSPIVGNNPLARETKNMMRALCRKRKRGHILKCMPRSRSAPPVSWGEAFLIKEYGSKPINALIFGRSAELASKYLKTAKKCSGLHKDKILSALRGLFRDYLDIAKANSMQPDPMSDDNTVWRMIWLCEYVAWFIEENISFSEWTQQEEVVSFFKDKYSWATVASHASSFWIHGNGNALSAIRDMADQLHGEIWIWNSDLRVLRNKQWIEHIYLPLAHQYSIVKITVSDKIASKARNEWKKELIGSLNSMAAVGADSKIHIGVINGDASEGSLVALFGAHSTTFDGKRIVMITPTFVEGQDHECVNFVLEPSGGSNNAGEVAVVSTLQREMNRKMQEIQFQPMRSVLS